MHAYFLSLSFFEKRRHRRKKLGICQYEPCYSLNVSLKVQLLETSSQCNSVGRWSLIKRRLHNQGLSHEWLMALLR
jgi:hypothetical protein